MTDPAAHNDIITISDCVLFHVNLMKNYFIYTSCIFRASLFPRKYGHFDVLKVTDFVDLSRPTFDKKHPACHQHELIESLRESIITLEQYVRLSQN